MIINQAQNVIDNKTSAQIPSNKILLTFDVEEFDAAIAYGNNLGLTEQIEVSRKGLILIQKMLKNLSVSATFFTTGTFANHNPELIYNLSLDHEIASHGMYHGSFDPSKDLDGSKYILEEITGSQIVGFRMPRMGEVNETDLQKAGYLYNSSLNPTYMPGRYNNLDKSVMPSFKDDILNIPVSVSPTFRIPLFWLSFKNFPMSLYRQLSMRSLKENGFLNIYFHPWEFTDLSKFKMPGYMKRYSKDLLIERLEKYLFWLKEKGDFITLQEYARSFNSQN